MESHSILAALRRRFLGVGFRVIDAAISISATIATRLLDQVVVIWRADCAIEHDLVVPEVFNKLKLKVKALNSTKERRLAEGSRNFWCLCHFQRAAHQGPYLCAANR